MRLGAAAECSLWISSTFLLFLLAAFQILMLVTSHTSSRRTRYPWCTRFSVWTIRIRWLEQMRHDAFSKKWMLGLSGGSHTSRVISRTCFWNSDYRERSLHHFIRSHDTAAHELQSLVCCVGLSKRTVCLSMLRGKHPITSVLLDSTGSITHMLYSWP